MRNKTLTTPCIRNFMTALILVDIQNDFMEGGSLAVPEAESIIGPVNQHLENYTLVAATQDWHPPDHQSFASNHDGKEPFDVIRVDGHEQVLWPDHCLQGSAGADFHPDLAIDKITAFFRKGINPEVDSYSGFFDNDRQCCTGLAEWLQAHDVDEVHVAGLAAEYCVAYTARDAAQLSFKTTVLLDGTRALKEEDFTDVRRQLEKDGVRFL